MYINLMLKVSVICVLKYLYLLKSESILTQQSKSSLILFGFGNRYFSFSVLQYLFV